MGDRRKTHKGESLEGKFNKTVTLKQGGFEKTLHKGKFLGIGFSHRFSFKPKAFKNRPWLGARVCSLLKEWFKEVFQNPFPYRAHPVINRYNRRIRR